MKTAKKTVSITKQWQVYLPEVIREQVGLEAPVKVEISTRNGVIFLRPQASKIVTLKDSVTTKIPPDLNKLRDQMDYVDETRL